MSDKYYNTNFSITTSSFFRKICEDGGSTVYGRVPALIRSLADGYKCLCDIQDSSIEKKKSRRDVRMEINREFFGLRDYYRCVNIGKSSVYALT